LLPGFVVDQEVLGHVISLYFGFAPSELFDFRSTVIFTLLLTEKTSDQFLRNFKSRNAFLEIENI
jgi:hypothetical protein